jgi:hypothetical protein
MDASDATTDVVSAQATANRSGDWLRVDASSPVEATAARVAAIWG